MNKLKYSIRDINNDWQEAIPQLVKLSQNKFYQVLGPLVIGLEIIKLPHIEEYRPHVVIYTLWGNKMGNDLKSCLSAPSLVVDLDNEKGLQFDISFKNHSRQLHEAVLQFEKQFTIPIGKNVKCERIIKNLNDYMNAKKILTQGIIRQVVLSEMKYYLSIYSKRPDLAKVILNEISRNKKNWILMKFEDIFGNFETWLSSLKNIDGEMFFQTIEKNKRDEKLSKLPYFEVMG